VQTSLKSQTLRAVLWSIIRVGWRNLAAFVMFATLARILQPREFGLYALAAAVFEIGRVLVNAGIADAVQRERELDEETADTAFFTGIVISLLLVLLIAATAIPYARLMHNEELAPILMVLSLALPVIAIGNVHVARILRDFGHKYIAIRAVLAGLVAGAIAIAAAFLGAGVWALVIQLLCTELISTVMAWMALRWRPRLRFRLASLRHLLSFGGSIMLTQLLWTALSRSTDFFIGQTLGVNANGTYRVALRLIDLLGQSILQPIGSVALVTLGRLQDDAQAFRNAYCRFVGISALFALPAIFGFGLIARDLVPLIFGAQWVLSGKIAAIASISALPFTLNYFFPSTLAAKGRSAVLAMIALVQLVSTLLLGWLTVGYGLPVLAGAMALRAYLTMPYIQLQLRRFAGIRLRDTWQATAAPMLCCGIMVAAVLLGQYLFIGGLPKPLQRICTSVAIALAVYTLSLLLLARDGVNSHFSAVRALLKPGVPEA
jgi:O-antigen/teichoic acid export membrane protein